MKSLRISIAASLLLQAICSAATIGIAISSDSRSLRDEFGVALSGGNPAVSADGAQVHLGYFSDAIQANPFGTSGTDAISSFVALTGPGTPFGVNFTIGDSVANGANSGELFVDAFAINTGIADGLLPAVGTPLVLRIFNSNQTFLTDLSNTSGLWNWKAPATPASSLVLEFDLGTLVSRGTGLNNRSTVAASAEQIQTNNAVPEPASAALFMVGLVSLASRRRRAAK